MKTALVSTCYLDGTDPLGNNRLERNKRYLKYYYDIRRELNFDEILLLDNASPEHLREELQHFADDNHISLSWIFFGNHLTRPPGLHNYPYSWRGLYHYSVLMKHYDKIIHIDSDGFVLTKRLAHYIRDLKSGWTTFWSHTHNFPECCLHVLCPDAYPVLTKYFEVPWEKRVGEYMEKALPFTHVERNFKCGRYGEIMHEDRKQRPDMDFYGQGTLDIPLIFEMGK